MTWIQEQYETINEAAVNGSDKLENDEAIRERLDMTHIRLMWRGKR